MAKGSAGGFSGGDLGRSRCLDAMVVGIRGRDRRSGGGVASPGSRAGDCGFKNARVGTRWRNCVDGGMGRTDAERSEDQPGVYAAGESSARIRVGDSGGADGKDASAGKKAVLPLHRSGQPDIESYL